MQDACIFGSFFQCIARSSCGKWSTAEEARDACVLEMMRACFEKARRVSTPMDAIRCTSMLIEPNCPQRKAVRMLFERAARADSSAPSATQVEARPMQWAAYAAKVVRNWAAFHMRGVHRVLCVRVVSQLAADLNQVALHVEGEWFWPRWNDAYYSPHRTLAYEISRLSGPDGIFFSLRQREATDPPDTVGPPLLLLRSGDSFSLSLDDEIAAAVSMSAYALWRTDGVHEACQEAEFALTGSAAGGVHVALLRSSPPADALYFVYPGDSSFTLLPELPDGQFLYIFRDGRHLEARIEDHERYVYFALPADAQSVSLVQSASEEDAVRAIQQR